MIVTLFLPRKCFSMEEVSFARKLDFLIPASASSGIVLSIQENVGIGAFNQTFEVYCALNTVSLSFNNCRKSKMFTPSKIHNIALHHCNNISLVNRKKNKSIKRIIKVTSIKIFLVMCYFKLYF